MELMVYCFAFTIAFLGGLAVGMVLIMVIGHDYISPRHDYPNREEVEDWTSQRSHRPRL